MRFQLIHVLAARVLRGDSVGSEVLGLPAGLGMFATGVEGLGTLRGARQMGAARLHESQLRR